MHLGQEEILVVVSKKKAKNSSGQFSARFGSLVTQLDPLKCLPAHEGLQLGGSDLSEPHVMQLSAVFPHVAHLESHGLHKLFISWKKPLGHKEHVSVKGFRSPDFIGMPISITVGSIG